MAKEIAPVLLIFFNRPETLKITFEQIRKVKPQKLYLAQDGPRENNEYDKKNILKCQKIVEKIDWDCKVYRHYSQKNLGCGMGPKTAIDWLFENEDEGIILEDDCVASQSFFPFCTEMLEKYQKDKNVFLITGCNLELKTECKDSYFFALAGTNCGWATWKKNWIKNDYSCKFVKDKALLNRIKKKIKTINKNAAKNEIASFIETNKLVNKGIKLSYWDVQWQSVRYVNNQLSIIPSKNLITNIGLGTMSTHATQSKIPEKLYSNVGEIHACYNKKFELAFPLKHPEKIVQNEVYDKKVYKNLYPSFLKKNIGRAIRFSKRVFLKIWKKG